MYAKMHGQAAGMPKASMTVWTWEGLLATVYPTVLFQVPWLSKGCITLAACIGFLAGVNTHMTHKVAIICVHCLAVLARVLLGTPHRPLPHVSQRMSFQVLRSRESGPAVETREGSET